MSIITIFSKLEQGHFSYAGSTIRTMIVVAVAVMLTPITVTVFTHVTALINASVGRIPGL